MKHFLGISFVLLLQLASAQDSKENADFKLAVNLYNDKLYDLALEQFRTYLSLYPSAPQSIDARFYLGLTQSKLGMFDEARLTFQNFALAYPDNGRAPEAWMNVADAYVAMKNIREAALAYERVKMFHPRSKFAPIALVKASEYYEKFGDRENTRRVLRILTQEYSSSEVLPARIKLAQMLLDDNQPEQARQECKRVLDGAKDQILKAQALLVVSKAFNGLGKAQDAEDALQNIILNYKSTASYYTALLEFGRVKSSNGSIDAAISTWCKLAEDSINAPNQLRQDAYLEMSEANVRIRGFSRALELFDLAANIRGNRNGEALYRAGVAAERLGNVAKASVLYARAVTDSLGNVDRRAMLIGAFKAAKYAKNSTEAVRLVQVYKQDYPTDINLPRLLVEGAVLATVDLSEPKTAYDFCNWLLKNFPENRYVDNAMYQLGIAYRTAGDYENAIATLDNLQRRYPSSEFVPDAQKQIWLIKEFDQQQKETSLQKLALLVGDVIAQKSKGNLAFRLAEIYYHELKNYQLAAEQYRFALSQDLDETMRPLAWYYRAQSFEHLGLRDGIQTENGRLNIQKAISCYDSLVVLFPAGEFIDKAAVAAFSYRLQLAEKADDIRRLGSDFFANTSAMRGKDLALFALGNSYLLSRKYEDAVLTYKLLLEKYPNGDVAPSAQFQLGVSLSSMMMQDSANKILNRFILHYPNHPQCAQAISILLQSAADSGQIAKVNELCDLMQKRYFYSPYNENLDLMKAQTYFQAREYTRATEMYKSALSSMSSDFFVIAIDDELERTILYRLGASYEILKNKQEARRWYGEYITRDQSSERAGKVYQALASIAKSENRIDLATSYLKEASRIASKLGKQVSSIAYETAEMMFHSEKYSDAIVKYTEAMKQTNTDSIIRQLQVRLVVCFFRLDNLDEGNKRAMEFIKKNPGAYNEAAEFEFERGKYLMRKNKIADAKQRFDKVLNNYPNAAIVPEALFWIARVYELDQKMQRAVVIYDSLLQQYPNSEIIPRVHLSLGNAYYAMEQWDAASKQYRVILENEQRSPDLVQVAMSNLIVTYKEMEMFDGALELTRKYIERYPNDPDLIDKKIDVGILYQKLGYYDQSILQLQNLIEAGNTDLEAELRYYIGESNFYKGDYQQAILEFLKVPYLVTKQGKIDWMSTSYYMAGQSYEKMSKYDQALTMYKQIIDRKDTGTQYKTAAQKEIERVRTIIGNK